MASIKLTLLLSFAVALLAGCSSLPAGKTNDLCDLFEYKKGWYKDAKKASKKWRAPIPILMSFIYQESHFDANARPPRRKILWVFPGPRISSAFGYAQAQNGTWEWYQNSTGKRFAQRDKFSDAIDFIGWYNHQSNIKNKIEKTDSYRLYLAYHEGHGGYSKQSYRSKQWLLSVAQKVAAREREYGKDLQRCQKKLDKRWRLF